MFREIEEKRRLLESKKPYPAMTAEKITKLDLFDFTFNNLKLDGSILTVEGMNQILNGGIVSGVSIADHNAANNHRMLIKKFNDMKHMSTTINVRELKSIYSTLMDIPNPVYRKGNPILFQFNYTTPFSEDIQGLLIEIFRKTFNTERYLDFIDLAVDIHMGIIKVYPFDEGSEMLARSVIQYALYSNGFPLIQFGLSEQAYNDLVSEAIRRQDHSRLYHAVLEALNFKLDTLLNYLDS